MGAITTYKPPEPDDAERDVEQIEKREYRVDLCKKIYTENPQYDSEDIVYKNGFVAYPSGAHNFRAHIHITDCTGIIELMYYIKLILNCYNLN